MESSENALIALDNNIQELRGEYEDRELTPATAMLYEALTNLIEILEKALPDAFARRANRPQTREDDPNR